MLHFETIRNNDLKKIRHLQPEGWPDIVSEFEFYINSTFCNPIKTSVNNKIVGIGASVIFDNTAWIAHIIVDKDFRKKGIGYMIVESLLNKLKKDNIDTCILIATKIGKSVYLKSGFKIVSEYSYFKREKAWNNIPISKKIIQYKDEYYSMIIRLDKKISGENREGLLKDYIQNSMVFIDNNNVKGYYFPDLGEGLIVAETEEAGLELMKLKYAKVDNAVIPSENKVGIDFLKQTSFVESETKGTRMILGKDISWMSEKIFSRIGGNFG